MEISELLNILNAGEDTTHQFKQDIDNIKSLSAELVAFSNTKGGKLIIGVTDLGDIIGLSKEDVHRLNQMISNVASEHVQPAINPSTEIIATPNGVVIVVEVPKGNNRPYQDKDGTFWVKCGADKRKATSREEIQRMFQEGGLVFGDEMIVPSATIEDLDIKYFADFYKKAYGKSYVNEPLPLPALLKNMKLLKEDNLTVAGTLLFAKDPQFKLPSFIITAVTMDAYDIASTEYIDNRDFTGNFTDICNKTLFFIISNLKHIQNGQGFNSVGVPEIPAQAIEEFITNALIHRDYFISAPIRVFVLRDRVEIISPGHLPNSLTVENIRSGIAIRRNSVIASNARHLLPYRGLGSGIVRALQIFPDIDFIDDRDGNMFKVILKRKGYE